MIGHDRSNALLPHGQNVEPEQNGPDAILFAHMVGPGARAFLTADGRHAGVQKVAEEFPAGRRFIERRAQLFRDPVGCAAGRHGARDALEPSLIARRQMGVGGQHGERIRRRHIAVPAYDEVAVAVAVRRCAEIWRVGGHHPVV